MLQAVLALALADAPRSASLLAQAPVPSAENRSAPASEATPVVEQASAPGSPLAAPGAVVQGPPKARRSFADAYPGRVVAGYVAGGLAALAAPVGTLLFLTNNTQFVPGNWTAGLFVLIGVPVVSAWVAGPLAAMLTMGGWPVAGRVLTYALMGALFGLMTAAIPILGVVGVLGGPMVAAVHAVATSPAEAFGAPQGEPGPTSPGPLLSFAF